MISRFTFLLILLVCSYEAKACMPPDFNKSRYTSALSFKGKVISLYKSDSFIEDQSGLPFLRARIEITEIFKGKIEPTLIVREFTKQRSEPCSCTIGFLVKAYETQRILEFHLRDNEPEPFVCNFFNVN